MKRIANVRLRFVKIVYKTIDLQVCQNSTNLRQFFVLGPKIKAAFSNYFLKKFYTHMSFNDFKDTAMQIGKLQINYGSLSIDWFICKQNIAIKWPNNFKFQNFQDIDFIFEGSNQTKLRIFKTILLIAYNVWIWNRNKKNYKKFQRGCVQRIYVG